MKTKGRLSQLPGTRGDVEAASPASSTVPTKFPSCCMHAPLALLTFKPFCLARSCQILNSRQTKATRCPAPLETTGTKCLCTVVTQGLRGLLTITSLGNTQHCNPGIELCLCVTPQLDSSQLITLCEPNWLQTVFSNVTTVKGKKNRSRGLCGVTNDCCMLG